MRTFVCINGWDGVDGGVRGVKRRKASKKNTRRSPSSKHHQNNKICAHQAVDHTQALNGAEFVVQSLTLHIFVPVTCDGCSVVFISMRLPCMLIVTKDVIDLDKTFHIYCTSQDVVELHKASHTNCSALDTILTLLTSNHSYTYRLVPTLLSQRP